MDSKVLYLLCIDTRAVLKEYNICHHYQTKHSLQYSQLTGKQWSEKLEHLKWNILSQQNFFTKIINENKAAKVSCQVAHFLAKQRKPFTDGGLIKCLIAVAKEMCLEKINLFKTLSLLVRTDAQS